jgi:hypothetical protein
VPRQRKNINKGITLYNKILKEFTRVNSTLPEERKLSVSERRKYISEKIYPQYKGTSASRVGIRAINVSIVQVLDTIVPKEGCDVNYISPAINSDVAWFDLDDHIRDVLPKCIYVRVDAGELGSTRIFNTLNYNYSRSGVQKICDAVRDAVQNSSDAYFTGINKLKKGKANDGTPENYYIDFILVVDSRPIKPLEPVAYSLPKGEKKKVTSVRNAILERVKDLNLKKKRKKNARKTAINNIKEIKKKNKRLEKAKSPKFKQKLKYQRLKDYLKTKKQLQNAYNKGNLTKEQYERFVSEVDRLIELIKKEGGIV